MTFLLEYVNEMYMLITAWNYDEWMVDFIYGIRVNRLRGDKRVFDWGHVLTRDGYFFQGFRDVVYRALYNSCWPFQGSVI